MTDIKKTPAISVITYAYNVEDYIRECAESILNQTFTDFEWIILDNGCTDKTGQVLDEYARKDNRIKLFRNQKNSILHHVPLNPDFVHYGENLTSEYWCVVDSDDFLHADFMKELYTVAKKYDADIALGGTEMFMEENPERRGTRCPMDFYSGDITSLGDIFPEIYGCFRPMWGKLFKVSVVKKQQKYRKQFPVNLTNGGDTVFNLDCLRFSNSVVGINKVLHYYRIRRTSYYNTQVDRSRYLDYKVIYEESKNLLLRWNKLNDTTLNFITIVFYGSLKDCIEIAATAVSIPTQERIAVMEAICNDPFVYQILSPFGLTANLFTDTQNAIEIVMKDEQWGEFSDLTNHYMYRLFKSVKMVNNPLANQQTKQNAFLLYLSSLCDESNTNQFGAILLYSFLRAIGKTELAEFDQAGIKREFLASNPGLLRKLLHSDFHQAVKICEEHSDDENYALLKEELKRKGDQFYDPPTNANEFLRRHMPDENIMEAIEFLANALDRYPLDKETLLYKLYLLTLQGDMQTALETAETLRVFYPDDCTSLIVVAHTFACAGQKDQAKEILKKALNKSMDETKQLEITRIIEGL